jgi:tRNA(Ile)-lysidine synthase
MLAVPSFIQKVLGDIRRQRLIQPGDRVGVAVSGGADSVALLRLLLALRNELGIVLSVVHLNHQLRGKEADGDEEFVKKLAQEHTLELFTESAAVKTCAQEKHLSLEAAGRKLRYDFFERLLNKNAVNRIATAHTLDDQAETVLLRMMRGAGTRGLAGIYPERSVGENGATIVRLLLGISRKELEAFLNEIQQSWREDSSNKDERHSRNRVRKNLLPWLEENLNPSVRSTLADTAEIARAEEEYWAQQIGALSLKRANSNAINATELLALPLALQRRLIRAVAEAQSMRLDFHHVEKVLELVRDPAARGPIPLPGGTVSKSAGKIVIDIDVKNDIRNDPENGVQISDSASFEYALSIPGRVAITEIQAEFHASLIPAASVESYNAQDFENLIDAQLLAQKLQVRNWREGDRFWPAHTKAPRKIKELLQQKRVTGPQRKVWPVIVSGSEIVWMRGFPPPAHLRSKIGTSSAVKIEEISLTGRS